MSNKICGIYGIFNAINGKVLVGSSVNINNRWRQHRNTCKSNIHQNPYFQKAWNKYGEQSFEFRILEECPIDVLIPREDYWMGYHMSLNRDHGYNMQSADRIFKSKEIYEKVAIKLRGRKRPEDVKRKVSEGLKGNIPWNKGIPCSEEAKKKISDSNKRQAAIVPHVTSPEQLKALAEGRRKYWEDWHISKDNQLQVAQ